MKALIVEDDRENAEFVAKGLFGIGFCSDIAGDGETGYKRLLHGSYEIAIVDIQLPGMSGLELTRKLRARGNRIPILILSSLNQAADRISGLNLGADDYLTKPFALNELTARVNAILRRTYPAQTDEQVIVGDLVINCSTHTATRGGTAIDLTPREFKLLEFLARNTARTITVRMILQEVWNCNSALTTVVESLMCKLRRKLNVDGRRDMIHTIRGFGYVLK